nr:PASTA domain-containing protein [Mycolicibacterium komanii]
MTTPRATVAPDVVGQTYSDAASAIEEEGDTAVVAARVGDKLDQGDCIVTNAWDASFLRIDASGAQVHLALNCAGGYATATNPGAFINNPVGRAAKSKAEEEAENQELEELEAPVTPDE